MSSKKNDKQEKRKKIDQHRTLEERKAELIPVIHKLSELTLTTQYDEIKELYRLFKIYIDNGERIEIKINFPAIQRRIIGVLAINKREKVWIKLEQLQ
jgi:hypothetical protein